MEQRWDNVLRVSFLLCVEHISLTFNLSQIWMSTNTSVTLRGTNVLRDKCAPTMLFRNGHYGYTLLQYWVRCVWELE
jgi:hypothetical protein